MDKKTTGKCAHLNMILCDHCGKPMCDDCGLSCTCDHVKINTKK
ncbi:MAG: hypothetical protein WCX61_04950 [Candidatus Peribacteraceae bacterium]